jgi:phosphatidylglycerophosphatase A
VAALEYLPLGRYWQWVSLPAAAVAIFTLGIQAAGDSEKFFGRSDPGPVVIDEVVGQMITFFGWPDAPWRDLLAGFLLFRIFDVLKPFPARRAERVSGGWGIMLDDLVAGVYSLIALLLIGLILQ